MEACRMRFGFNVFVPMLVLVPLCGIVALAQTPIYNLGKSPSAEELRAWDISISPEGKGLPAGSGTAKEGAKLYAEQCALCHGPNGEGRAKLGPALIGGRGTLTALKPLKTVGSFWPFATSVWDYINRAMPLNRPQSLTPDQVYAVTAFLLYKSDIIKEEDVLDAKTLPKIQMPNRNGFIPVRLEDIQEKRCRRGTCP